MPNFSARVLVCGALGGVFLYSGIKGKSISSSIRSLIAGQSPASVDTSAPIDGQSVAASETNIDQASASTGGSQSANQTLGQLLAAPYGWNTGTEWTDLVSLWNRESGWNNRADNPSSHAYGIAQALPSTKYPLAGQPESQGGTSDAATQIRWGLSYISSRYGTPSAAWSHEISAGWY